MKIFFYIIVLLFICNGTVLAQKKENDIIFKDLYYENDEGAIIIHERHNDRNLYLAIEDRSIINKEHIRLEKNNAYYYNKDNEKIIIPYYNPDFLYLTIKTENSIDKELTITFNEHDPDFIYKRRYYSVGDSFTYTIPNDSVSIKLVLFNKHNKKHLRIKKRTLRKNTLE